MASSFADRLRDARSNLSHSYDRLNTVWKDAETLFRSVGISDPISVCFQVESEDGTWGRDFEHCLVYKKVRDQWRICYSLGEANDPDSHGPKPVLECSVAERRRALAGLPLLGSTIVDEVQRAATSMKAEILAATECVTQIEIGLTRVAEASEVRDSMTVREVLKLIEEDGWTLVATRGSHRQYKHPTKPGRVTVAGKPRDDLTPGTLNSILKQAGLKT